MQLKSISILLLLCSGCAMHRTNDTTTNYLPFTDANGKTNLVKSIDRTTYVGISWFNKTSVTGLEVGKRTGKETTTLSLGKAQTETQSEAIKALGEALAAGIVSGAKKSVIP